MGRVSMALQYLIDSTILIDHLNGISKATKWLSGLEFDEAAVSVITRAEVLVRAGEKEEAVKLFLDGYRCLPIDASTADLAAKLRNQWRWKLPDAFQAALAEKHSLIFVTRDKKDFGKASELTIKVPYEL